MPVFPVYNQCNNACLMCSNPPDLWRRGDYRLSRLLRRIRNFRSGRKEFQEVFSDSFMLTGGEPTLHPQLFELITNIRTLFPATPIRCQSNGRRFSRPDFTRRFLRLSPYLEVIISLHGPTAALHDQVTRIPGSFAQTCRGIANILKDKRPGQCLELRIVIHRLNHTHLAATTRFIRRKFPGVDRLVYIFFEMEGRACRHLRKLKVSYRQVRPHVEKLAGLVASFPEVRFYHFPLCTLPVALYSYVYRTLPDREVAFVVACRGCCVKKFCLGVPKAYLKHVGRREFKPVPGGLRFEEGPGRHHPIARVLDPDGASF